MHTYLVNHGMSNEFLDQVREATKEFFGLSQEQKKLYARTDDREGYGTDNVYEDHTINWNDRLHLVVYPERQRKLHFWPKSPSFRDVVHEFTIKSRELVMELLRTMAMALKLKEKSFLEQYREEGLMFGRFNYYPPCPRPDVVLGIKPHTDGTAITILLQDDKVEALQVQKDDSWFRVPIFPHALFINVGDQMEIMSNGLFKSVFHKVTTNKERERISLALLCAPEPNKEIGPATELVNAQTPQRLNKVKDYGKIYFQINPTDNKRPIDLLKSKEDTSDEKNNDPI
ncbi:hypothetical protein V2J09_013133 [Rumex salicifolius]